MAIQTRTFNGSTGNSNWSWKIIVTEEIGDIINKTSPVKVEAYLGRPSSASYFRGSATITYRAGSQTYTQNFNASSQINVPAGGWYKMGEHTFSVSNTGSSSNPTSISVSTNMSGASFSPNTASASGSITLAVLHEAPTLNSVSFVENSSVLQNIGLSPNDFVPYLSNKMATIEATTYDGATITQYRIINGTTSFTSSTSSVNLDFTAAGIEMAYYYETSVSREIPQLIIELTDDKGGISSYNYTNTTYVMYAKPNLVQTSSSVKRNGQLSGKVIMNLVGTHYNGTIGNQTNSVSLSYKYWKTSEVEPDTYYPISNATTIGSVVRVEDWEVSKNGTAITDVDSNYAYYFKVKMVDYFLEESHIILNVPVGEYIRALLKDRVDFKRITIGLNDIVESGNNANGYYIKYYDGTMICYGFVSFSANSNTETWTFPKTFIDTNIFVSGTPMYVAGKSNSANIIVTTSTISTTSVVLINWFAGETTPNYARDIRVFAIGRWK